jgi:choice-of-anchor C domain-containing protein
MQFKNLVFGAVASASMLGASIAPAFAANLVTNGSFETGTAPGVFLTLAAGAPDITDWTIASGTVDYIGSYWVASDGDRSIDMTGYSAGTMSQTFPTTVGAKYIASFDMSGNPAGPPAEKSLNVDTGGAPTLFTYDVLGFGTTLADMKWETKMLPFTATAATTTLTFASLNSGYFGPAIDTVSVEQYLPTTKDDCKKGGWEDFGVFKNQGDCVSYVATGGTNLPALQ